MNDLILDETDELPRALTAPQSLAVSIVRAEIDQQITTARAYPRSLKQVSDRVFSLATLDKESAEESMYALPRGGKPITGPSIRFAEIVKQAYGNCRAAARVSHVDRDEKYVEAEGVFHDLETNVATTARVRRRIVDSKGKLYSDDMIIVTGNAACSIALRNAIMGGVPKPLWRKAYEAVQATIKGDITTLTENRTKALQAFAIYGVKPEQVFAALGVLGAEDITVEHIPVLRGMFGTLKNGEATVEEMFPVTAATSAPQALHSGFGDQKLAAQPPQTQEPTAPQETGAPAKRTRGKAAAKPPEPEIPPHNPDTGEVIEGGNAPTETAGAPAAETTLATPATATDASTSGAVETSSPQTSSASPATSSPEPEEVDSIAEGVPAAGEVYHLDGDRWLGDGKRDTYKDGKPFSAAGRSAGLAIYDDHAPETQTQEIARAGAEKTVAEQISHVEPAADAEPLNPEVLAYAEAIKAAPDFQTVKATLAAFQKTQAWKDMSADDADGVRFNTWDIMVETGLAAKVNPADDVSAFRLWIEWQEDPEMIERTLSKLEEDQEFRAKPDSLKENIRASTAKRIKQILGE